MPEEGPPQAAPAAGDAHIRPAVLIGQQSPQRPYSPHVRRGHRGVDVGGFAIEDFGLPENLMPAVNLAEIGLPIVVASNGP
jgi:hypothetical protein